MAWLMFSSLPKHNFYGTVYVFSIIKHDLIHKLYFNIMSLTGLPAHVFLVFYSLQVAKEFLVLSLLKPYLAKASSHQKIFFIIVVVCVNHLVYVACRHS